MTGLMNFTEKYNLTVLVIVILIILALLGVGKEFDRIKAWSSNALHNTDANSEKIEHLEKEIKKVGDKPVPPPVIIVQEKKVNVTQKPFADDRALLARARKLREQQKASSDNR
jgi:hypothetical protein